MDHLSRGAAFPSSPGSAAAEKKGGPEQSAHSDEPAGSAIQAKPAGAAGGSDMGRQGMVRRWRAGVLAAALAASSGCVCCLCPVAPVSDDAAARAAALPPA